MNRVLLNYLPPSDIYTPSASLSILKSFMLENGVNTDIIYWNLLFKSALPLQDSDEIEEAIIPFISILNDQFANSKGNEKSLALLKELLLEKDYSHDLDFNKLLEESKSDIYEVIERELDKIDFEEVLLFGVSSKFHQWIPGIILTQEVKKISPNTNIIVGGFGSVQSAMEAMKLNHNFDFATWGEGEYPLLELSKQLKKNKADFNSVPRLIFRTDGKLMISTNNRSEYLDMQTYIYPNYDDYFETYPTDEHKYKIVVPINSSRACSWNKCKFCDYNRGYKYRSRSAECILGEIEHIANKYKSVCFTFVDNDVFVNPQHFEKLLDLIISSIAKYNFDYEFWAEMIPNDKLNARIMRKMQQAGFSQIFIGYDAITDSLLQKMEKSNSFSSNIMFLKFSLKNEIYPLVNIIKGIPDETAVDVKESMNNLHFLRFFYNKGEYSLYHEYVTLVVSNMTKYFTLLSKDEKAEYNTNKIVDLLPHHFADGDSRFSLFRWQKKRIDNADLWEQILEKEGYYNENIYTYRIIVEGGQHFYQEFINNKTSVKLSLSEIDWQILKICNDKVCELNEVNLLMQEMFPEIGIAKLKEHLENLKSNHLLYHNKEISSIISVLDILK